MTQSINVSKNKSAYCFSILSINGPSNSNINSNSVLVETIHLLLSDKKDQRALIIKDLRVLE